MVLMSLGLVGALAVGGAFASRRFVDDARTSNRSLELRPAAERAIVLALAGVDSTLLALAPGSSIDGTVEVTQSVVTATWITVLGGGAVWVVAEARTTRKPLLRNRLAIVCQRRAGDTPGWAGAWFELP